MFEENVKLTINANRGQQKQNRALPQAVPAEHVAKSLFHSPGKQKKNVR